MGGLEVALEKEDRRAYVDIIESCKTGHCLTREERPNFHLVDGRIAAVAVGLVYCLVEALLCLGKQQAIMDPAAMLS